MHLADFLLLTHRGSPQTIVYSTIFSIAYYIKGFPHSSVGKESACKAGDPDLIPGSGRSAGERIGYPYQYSWASLVAQLVKNLPAMWETWVQSLGWEDPWRRKKLPTPVFWPGEFHGLSPWGCKESDMTELIQQHNTLKNEFEIFLALPFNRDTQQILKTLF